MPTINERIVITCHTIGPNAGKFRGASVSKLLIADDGKTFEAGLFPMSESELSAAWAGINADAVKLSESLEASQTALTTERDAAVAAKATLETQLATLTTEKATLQSQVDSIPALQSQVNTLETQVRQHEDAIWDRRMIDPTKWYDRLTRDNVLAISKRAITDTNVAVFADALEQSIAYRKEDPAYLMNIDHENAVNGVAYLQSVGVLSVDDGIRLLADSRKDEQ